MTEPFELPESAILAMEVCGIPEHMRGGLERFFNDKLEPGHFLSAVIDNDLREAVLRADNVNRQHIPNYIEWLYNHAPAGSWGHYQAVAEWCK